MANVTSGPQTIDTRIGTLEFTHDFANGFPTDATVQKLYDERDFQRACQAYLWALPAVSFTAWQRGINGLGARNGQIVAILSYEARRGILTANATTPYYLGFARNVVRVPVPNIAVACRHLPIGVELDAIGRVEIDHLHLPAQVLTLSQ